MKETFVKKYWDQEDILYFLHFKDNDAVRQIEISGGKMLFLNIDNRDDAKLIYDQSLDELELNEDYCITGDEFEVAWNDRES